MRPAAIGRFLRPVHQAVGLALQRLVQRAGPAGDDRNPASALIASLH
jgi:hypothetical protein